MSVIDNIEIRPRFKRNSAHSPEEIIQKIRTALEVSDVNVKGTIIDNHIILKIPLAEQHYWSPQLDLEIYEQEDGSSIISGRFGPRPSIWLMFVFFYSVLGFISLVIMIMGFAQLNLGMSAHILWFLLLIIIIFIIIFSTAKTGQKLGYDEMVRLKRFLLKALE